ncbi:MAG: methionine synthase [Chloroflexi bacterium]|nr:methionine synthase [Chloroflexota bacterium]
MNNGFQGNGFATAIGSMPHADPDEACSVVLRHLPEIPAWPQLPNLSFRENMYLQFAENFPGAVIMQERLYVDHREDLSKPLEELYHAYLENTVERYQTGKEYAAGLHALVNRGARGAVAVKGQVIGPISFGLASTDMSRRPLLYDDILADAIAKHLRLKAAWQERLLRRVSPQTIIFIDEPYLASIGSAFVSIPQVQITNLLEEVLQGITGLKGIHCCGNTDWSLLLSTSIDILSFDAYGYGESLGLYPADVKEFLHRGGIIAWGIVPNDQASLAKETVPSLLERLKDLWANLTSKGVPYELLATRCLVTPSCGLAGLSPGAAVGVLELLARVSQELRRGRSAQP